MVCRRISKPYVSGMGWFLIQRKICVAAALFALLIQFVASFEHIHLERTKAHSNLTGSIWDSGHASFHGGSDEPDGYVCDICAALSLAASAQIAIPPVLPTRFALYVVISATPTDAAPTRSPWVDFRSRAPPFA
jgi:hypothetical protein